MAMVKRRVANPAPALLSLVNPKRSNSMPEKSKKRRASTTAKRRNLMFFSTGKKEAATSRKSNPKKRVYKTRRNPISTGTVAEGFKLAGGGVLIGFAQPWVRGLVGKFLPTGPIASAAVTLGTAYGLGALANMTPYTRTMKRPIELAGWTIVGAQVISSYVLPWVNSIFSGLNLSAGNNATASGLGRARRRTMRDLVTLPAGNYDPYYGATPRIAAPVPAAAPVAEKVAMLKGLLTMPAMPGTSR